MHALAHISYPYILVNLVAILIGKPIPLEYNVMLILFSMIPDGDYIINFLMQKIEGKKYKVPLNHHSWPSHWPIVYVPLLIVALVTMSPFFLLGISAIYLHLFMDLFFDSDGMMLFYPFSKKKYKFFSKNTKNTLGLDWNKAYSKLLIYKVDRWAFLIFVLMFIFLWLQVLTLF